MGISGSQVTANSVFISAVSKSRIWKALFNEDKRAFNFIGNRFWKGITVKQSIFQNNQKANIAASKQKKQPIFLLYLFTEKRTFSINKIISRLLL